MPINMCVCVCVLFTNTIAARPLGSHVAWQLISALYAWLMCDWDFKMPVPTRVDEHATTRDVHLNGATASCGRAIMSRIQYQNESTAVADDIEQHNTTISSGPTHTPTPSHTRTRTHTKFVGPLMNWLVVRSTSRRRTFARLDYKYEACWHYAHAHTDKSMSHSVAQASNIFRFRNTFLVINKIMNLIWHSTVINTISHCIHRARPGSATWPHCA